MNIKEKKVKLLNRESELEFLPRLTEYLNGPKIYIKRDDEGGRSAGGNKLRKYEYLLGEALEKKCDTIIIVGHFQSNAARELVGVACQLELKSVVISKELIPNQNHIFLKNGNALLMNIMGAKIITINKEDDFEIAMKTIAKNITQEGGKPYIVPFGGSNALGALGYVNCVNEIVKQCEIQAINFPDYIFTATGSGGTQAGLIAGVLKNNKKTKVIGISVLQNRNAAEKGVAKLLYEMFDLVQLPEQSNDIVKIDDEFIGDGYGITTDESIRTIKLVAKLEGIFLCPVYTAKAMTGLITYIKSGKIKKNESVVFIHTGGSPLLYAYYDKLFE